MHQYQLKLYKEINFLVNMEKLYALHQAEDREADKHMSHMKMKMLQRIVFGRCMDHILMEEF